MKLIRGMILCQWKNTPVVDSVVSYGASKASKADSIFYGAVLFCGAVLGAYVFCVTKKADRK